MDNSVEELKHEYRFGFDSRRALNNSTLEKHVKAKDLMNIKELNHSKSSSRSVAENVNSNTLPA